MNLNNLYYGSLALTVFFTLIFIFCFFLFYYSGTSRMPERKITFLFFDFMLFRSGCLPNISALSIAGILIFGNLFDHIRNHNINTLHIHSIGFVATLLFFIHCRFLSDKTYNDQEIKCVREMFFNINLSLKSLFLWFSRVGYMVLLLCVFMG